MLPLQSASIRSVGLYRQYGFDLMREALIPKTSVTHYAMVRHPKGNSEP